MDQMRVNGPVSLGDVPVSPWFIGAPGEIRTPDLVVRSHALYPTELRARWRIVYTPVWFLVRHGVFVKISPYQGM